MVCADVMSWGALYGVEGPEGICGGDDPPLKCTVRSSKLFSFPTDGAMQAAGDDQPDAGAGDAPEADPALLE